MYWDWLKPRNVYNAHAAAEKIWQNTVRTYFKKLLPQHANFTIKIVHQKIALPYNALSKHYRTKLMPSVTKNISNRLSG